MKSFTYITHKLFIKDVKYTPDISIDNIDNIDNIDSIDNNTIKSCMSHIFNTHTIETNLHIDFVKAVFVFTDQSKFQELKKTYIDNLFFSDENRGLFLDFFCKVQRTYWAFNTLAKHIKSRYSKIKVTNDLFLAPILSSQKNMFRLYETNCSYLFTLQDLSRIIISAVCNSPMFYSEPITPKNPYSGIPFSISNLYNIYFAMRNQLAILPNVIYQLFLCEFNLSVFEKNNQLVIRDTYINQFIQNEDEDEVVESIYDMLQGFPKIKLDLEFPDKFIIESFKSVVIHFLHFKYTLDGSKRRIHYTIMNRKMNDIIQNCPTIGRKVFSLVNRKKYVSFVTLTGYSEPVLYVKQATKYIIVQDDTSEDEVAEDNYAHDSSNNNNTSFVFDADFSNRLDELIHMTDVPDDNLYDTDDEIEVNEDLYDP